MRSHLALLVVALATLAPACPPSPQPPDAGPDAGPGPPTPTPTQPPPVPPTDSGLDAGTGFPVVDASAPPPDDDKYPACKTACAALGQLHCPEAQTPLGGKTCYRVCADREATGNSLNPACVGAAKDPAAVRKCGVRCATP